MIYLYLQLTNFIEVSHHDGVMGMRAGKSIGKGA